MNRREVIQCTTCTIDVVCDLRDMPTYSELVTALRMARETVWRTPVASAPDQEQAERIRETCTALSALLARITD